jgi:hypothetical protein
MCENVLGQLTRIYFINYFCQRGSILLPVSYKLNSNLTRITGFTQFILMTNYCFLEYMKMLCKTQIYC